MKYYIIAGEASGDLHGAHLIKELYKQDTDAHIRCWGGDLMEAAGATLVSHYKERAFMGFLEVILNVRKILGFIKCCKEDIAQFHPDALIFIDNSGFNLRIATWAKPLGYSTHYYISPQVWASRSGRVKKIKASIDHMYVILPFVKEFYRQYNYPVDFVGHPLLDAITDRTPLHPEDFRATYGLDQRPIIALLPGSRKQEITKMLSLMLAAIDDFKDYQFVIAGAPSQEESFYQQFIKTDQVHLIMRKTYDILSVATAALVTSGTATLETALFKVPQVVCYKGSKISYEIAKRIINLEYISLVNLIMDREVVTELIQDDFNVKRICLELAKILDETHRKKLFEDYYALEKRLGGAGASAKTAAFIVQRTRQEI